MGSSGGGGGSGKVEYPGYMQTLHGTWLSEIDVTIGALQAAATPYATAAAYNPDTVLATIGTAITAYGTYLTNFSTGYIATAIAAAAADVLDEIYADAIPVFESGMSAINATQSSSFVVGEAILIAMATAKLAKEATGLHNLAAQGVLDGQFKLASMKMDHGKMSIIAKVEQSEKDLEIDIHDATWDLDLYKYGEDMMRSIGGGGAVSGISKPSKTQSALGGAMASASAGSVAGPYGAVIGAVVGGVAGYMSAS